METSEIPDKLLTAWIPPREAFPAVAAERVRTWWHRAQRVYPAATVKAWRCDGIIFAAYCRSQQLSALPATPGDGRGVCAPLQGVGEEAGDGAAVPVDDREVSSGSGAVQSLCVGSRADGSEGDDQRGVVAPAPGEGPWDGGNSGFSESRGDNLPTVRERAMLCVAYDAMTRRSELIAIDVEDLKFLGDGTGRLLIRRSKTDQAGEGHVAYLSRQTVRYLQAWLQKAGIKEGAGLSADHRARDGHVRSAGERENWGTTESRGGGPGVQGGGEVPQDAGGRS